MSGITFYHNPRCSKSRQALALLHEKGIEPVVVEYLKTPPDFSALKDILKFLGKEPQDIVRRREAQEENIAHLKGDALLRALVRCPRALERPIVVKGQRAIIGRPPENVLDFV